MSSSCRNSVTQGLSYVVKSAPVSVGIPTFARGGRLFHTVEQLAVCAPPPAEIIVHIDESDGELANTLAILFPSVVTLSSAQRVGPGGGRHRCLGVATQPLFVSFDDDSWPVDPDFFSEVTALFDRNPETAVLSASIYHPGEPQPPRTSEVSIVTDFIGCGHAIRVDAYRRTAGYIDRPWAYGIEEVDLAMQLYALELPILQCGSLRVFHDTLLSHHYRADIVASTVQNIALRAFLRYPVFLWPRALLQLGNVVVDLMKRRRFAGLGTGLFGIPGTLLRYSSQRRRLPADKVLAYLNARPRLTS